MGMRLKRPFALVLLAVSPLLVACGGSVSEIAFEDRPADELYNEALVYMNSGDYRFAEVKFQEVDRLHPHTDLARKSQVMIAYTNYSKGDYIEAINGARRFLTLYPNHEDAAYAQYILANSYYKQIPDITRDQSETQKAMKAFEELVEKYPDSEYAEDARRKVQGARDQLAGKEMEVGRYYLERDDNLAAINRFRKVAEDYQRTRHVEEALFRLTESYYALGITNEAQTAAAVLGHNFPDSPWYRDAYSLLNSGGFEPDESRSSWISRAFRGIDLL